MKVELVSFYWVAQAYGEDPGTPAFNIDALFTAETMDEAAEQGSVKQVRKLNVAQAAEHGFTLETIGAAFSTALALENEQLRNT